MGLVDVLALLLLIAIPVAVILIVVWVISRRIGRSRAVRPQPSSWTVSRIESL